MDQRHPTPVEDYTTTNLVLIFINLLWIFGLIWANFGILAVILVGWALNLLITRLEQYRARRAIKWTSSDA